MANPHPQLGLPGIQTALWRAAGVTLVDATPPVWPTAYTEFKNIRDVNFGFNKSDADLSHRDAAGFMDIHKPARLSIKPVEVTFMFNHAEASHFIATGALEYWDSATADTDRHDLDTFAIEMAIDDWETNSTKAYVLFDGYIADFDVKSAWDGGLDGAMTIQPTGEATFTAEAV